MIKKLAWNTFKNTGNINTFLELMEVENVERDLQKNRRRGAQKGHARHRLPAPPRKTSARVEVRDLRRTLRRVRGRLRIRRAREGRKGGRAYPRGFLRGVRDLHRCLRLQKTHGKQGTLRRSLRNCSGKERLCPRRACILCAREGEHRTDAHLL